MSTNQRRAVALRGATTCEVDSPDAICEATAELLGEMLLRNGATQADLISLVFTSTPDLVSDFPASAARKMGMGDVPLLCAAEIAVPGGLARCIRILAHLESAAARSDLKHVYLHRAVSLRSDLEGENQPSSST